MKKKVIIFVVILAIAIGAYFIYNRHKKNKLIDKTIKLGLSSKENFDAMATRKLLESMTLKEIQKYYDGMASAASLGIGSYNETNEALALGAYEAQSTFNQLIFGF